MSSFLEKVRNGRTHSCPIRGCDRRVPNYQLLCLTHWRRVPAHLRRQLFAAWDDGRGWGSAAHRDAMDACINAVMDGLTESEA